jgi:hypothetical protein
MRSEKRKTSPSKPPKAAPKVLPLPVPAPKEPGLITSFINMVDLAEALKTEQEKQSRDK